MVKEQKAIPSNNTISDNHPPQTGGIGDTTAAIDLRLVMNDVKAAEALDLSPTTLRKWRTTGRGPSYVKLGKNVRYRLEDLTAYLEKQRVARQ